MDKLLNLLLDESIDKQTYDDKQNKLRDELKQIDTKLRTNEVRSDGWIRLVEDAFDFATHAQIQFQQGDNTVRRSIVRKMGVNFILKDNKFEVELKPYLTPIKKDYPSLEKLYLKVRTKTDSQLTDDNIIFADIIKQWRAIWDSTSSQAL